jgi:hypothetical protein
MSPVIRLMFLHLRISLTITNSIHDEMIVELLIYFWYALHDKDNKTSGVTVTAAYKLYPV